ncbi:hypothetical protein KGA66_05975 [Actinocrinis puniceicyclus]|uniref:Uncharacterized protein n=1 Tax=Actinocrinis puniceicyclus TaxID=977794 RepID=A0A8J8BBZ3_9ACTN|nr:hypothetical protein [Actinocrinis puniceicyclus]MBS2962586.1 hypothetical protein [Actinocrinis puniceicyclus]
MDSWSVCFPFAAALVYIAGYTAMARWWRTPVGRSMVSLAVAIALALLPAVLHYAAGLALTRRWFRWYDRGSLNAIGVILLWRLVVLWRVQRARCPSEDHQPPHASGEDNAAH